MVVVHIVVCNKQGSRQLLSCGFATRKDHIRCQKISYFVLLKCKHQVFFSIAKKNFNCSFYEARELHQSYFPHHFLNDFSVKCRFHAVLWKDFFDRQNREFVIQLWSTKKSTLLLRSYRINLSIERNSAGVYCLAFFCRSCRCLPCQLLQK